MDLTDYEWLVGDAGRRALEEAILEGGQESLLALTARLRKQHPARRAHLLVEQITQRRRARQKFALAAQMYFTPVALEQATDEIVARYKASRFPPRGAVADFCCGIGGDALGLALACDEVRGFDRNPVHALFAAVNVGVYLEQAGLPRARFRASTAEMAACDGRPAAWHADPDRRSAGQRTTAIEQYDPPREVLDDWLARHPAAAIKLAPAANVPASWRQRAECEWISRGGECRQLVTWFGDLASRPGGSVATILATSEARRQVTGVPDAPLAWAEKIGRYVYEPDAAVLAAHLSGALAAELGLAGIDRETAYLTSDRPVIDAAVAGFEVLAILPFQLKGLRAYLRQHQLGHVEVKKRGVNCDPLALQKQLRGAGSERGVVLITRHRAKSIAIVARRFGLASAATAAVQPPD